MVFLAANIGCIGDREIACTYDEIANFAELILQDSYCSSLMVNTIYKRMSACKKNNRRTGVQRLGKK